MTKSDRNWAIKTIVPDEVYTDREDFTDCFYHAQRNPAHQNRGESNIGLCARQAVRNTKGQVKESGYG